VYSKYKMSFDKDTFEIFKMADRIFAQACEDYGEKGSFSSDGRNTVWEVELEDDALTRYMLKLMGTFGSVEKVA